MAVQRDVPRGIGEIFPATPASEPTHSAGAGVGRRWAIVLAGGEGSRLRPLTRSADGTPVPKQFCTLGGGGSLLAAAIRRAGRAGSRNGGISSSTSSTPGGWPSASMMLPFEPTSCW